MKIRALLGLICSVLGLNIGAAQTDSIGGVGTQNALLWRISGKGLAQPSYLYGTIHIIAAKDFFLTAATKSALSSVERVTFEIDMDKMTNPIRQLGMIRKAVMPHGMTLQKLLTPKEYAEVSAFFAQKGMQMTLLDRVKPLFLTALTTDESASMKDGSTKSYEMELYKIAQDSDKKVSGLETMAFQMAVFDSIPYADQAKMLYESIKGGNESEQQFERMVACYKAQDLDCLQAEMQSGEDMGSYEDVLLNDRNRNWIPLMAAQMEKQPVFFAVGAGHLPGQNGVITLLRAQGYTVTAVR